MKKKIFFICLIFILLSLYFSFRININIQNMTIEYNTTIEEPKAYFENKILGIKKEIDFKKAGDVNTDILGTYDIAYSAHYLCWSKTKYVQIKVIDMTKPVLTIDCDDDYYMGPDKEIPDFDKFAFDDYDGNITDKIEQKIEGNKLIYSVSDLSGNTSQKTITIHDEDIFPPEISLDGGDMILNLYDCYSEPGYKVVDNYDGEIQDIEIENNLNTKEAGTYAINYKAKDSSGNEIIATRNITVQNGTLPEKIIPEQKTIYLTFDDGPSEYTEKLLDILAKYDVKATFFVTNSKPEYSYVIKKEIEAGHAVGIHTLTHEYSSIYQSKDAYIDDFIAMHDIIFEETGVNTRMFRFPGGSSNNISANYCPGLMTELTTYFNDVGYQYYDWNVSSGDAGSKASTETVYENVIEGINENEIAIVLQHDTKDFSIDAVEDIIKYGLENGYTFDKLSLSSPTAHHNVCN